MCEVVSWIPDQRADTRSHFRRAKARRLDQSGKQGGSVCQVNRMKLGHAAALALVGWYLMTPPTSKDKIHDDLPLSQWVKVQSFDTELQCQNALTDSYNPSIDKRMRGTTKSEAYKLFKQFMEDMRCVSTDDPRLKEK